MSRTYAVVRLWKPHSGDGNPGSLVVAMANHLIDDRASIGHISIEICTNEKKYYFSFWPDLELKSIVSSTKGRLYTLENDILDEKMLSFHESIVLDLTEAEIEQVFANLKNLFSDEAIQWCENAGVREEGEKFFEVQDLRWYIINSTEARSCCGLVASILHDTSHYSGSLYVLSTPGEIFTKLASGALEDKSVVFKILHSIKIHIENDRVSEALFELKHLSSIYKSNDFSLQHASLGRKLYQFYKMIQSSTNVLVNMGITSANDNAYLKSEYFALDMLKIDPELYATNYFLNAVKLAALYQFQKDRSKQLEEICQVLESIPLRPKSYYLRFTGMLGDPILSLISALSLNIHRGDAVTLKDLIIEIDYRVNDNLLESVLSKISWRYNAEILKSLEVIEDQFDVDKDLVEVYRALSGSDDVRFSSAICKNLLILPNERFQENTIERLTWLTNFLITYQNFQDTAELVCERMIRKAIGLLGNNSILAKLYYEELFNAISSFNQPQQWKEYLEVILVCRVVTLRILGEYNKAYECICKHVGGLMAIIPQVAASNLKYNWYGYLRLPNAKVRLSQQLVNCDQDNDMIVLISHRDWRDNTIFGKTLFVLRQKLVEMFSVTAVNDVEKREPLPLPH